MNAAHIAFQINSSGIFLSDTAFFAAFDLRLSATTVQDCTALMTCGIQISLGRFFAALMRVEKCMWRYAYIMIAIFVVLLISSAKIMTDSDRVVYCLPIWIFICIVGLNSTYSTYRCSLTLKKIRQKLDVPKEPIPLGDRHSVSSLKSSKGLLHNSGSGGGKIPVEFKLSLVVQNTDVFVINPIMIYVVILVFGMTLEPFLKLWLPISSPKGKKVELTSSLIEHRHFLDTNFLKQIVISLKQ